MSALYRVTYLAVTDTTVYCLQRERLSNFQRVRCHIHLMHSRHCKHKTHDENKLPYMLLSADMTVSLLQM